MLSMDVLKIGIRTLVEFVMRAGDIDSGFFVKDRMLEGARIHRKIQSMKPESYKAEYYLKLEIPFDDTVFVLDGRADGVDVDGDEVIIDEIKTTTVELQSIEEEHNLLHWAQAKCYGYIYCVLNDLEKIQIQLTYVYTETMETKIFVREFDKGDLEEFVYGLLKSYSVWAKLKNDWTKNRTRTLCSLEFPFSTYRKGQREMAASVYNVIGRKKKLYISAPTGIGKTVSALFPSLKAMADEKCDKIFYLTAKEITRYVAEDSVLMMQENGAWIKSVTITAKGKICFLDEPSCNPIDCRYAKGHFDRINEALLDMLQSESFISKEKIIEYAQKYNVCPYEFSLDISEWTDIVICDYNYLFDPRAKLKRYFFDDIQNPFVYLVDEAHNLLDRSREMYSAQTDKSSFMKVRKILDKKSGLYKHAGKINKYFLEIKKEQGEKEYSVCEEEPTEIIKLISRWVDLSERWLKNNAGHEHYKTVLELYFEALAYMRISDQYSEEYCTVIRVSGHNVYVKLFCLNPSRLLEKCFATGISSVVFSATLSPISYYFDILGGNDDDFRVNIDSPFNRENLCLVSASNISTKYVHRENTYDSVVEMIFTMVGHRKGNYLVYFPSYSYMNEIYRRFVEKHSEINTIIQNGSMNKQEQQDFIDNFDAENERTLVGFSVLGGVFSEGIDLKGDKLFGTIIVGVGLPQVNVYQNVVKDYFDKTRGDGFAYAYVYPGFNKVMQAAGRVIRTEVDKGVVFLIDERFCHRSYQKLFPKHWHHIKYIESQASLEHCLNEFSKNSYKD